MTAPTTDRGGINQTVHTLHDAGWMPLWVDYNDGDEPEQYPADVTAHKVVEDVMAVDDAFLVVEKGEERGWVRFVMGNDPDEVVCDYTVKLEDALSAMFDRWNA